jgi:hypothetical protein
MESSTVRKDTVGGGPAEVPAGAASLVMVVVIMPTGDNAPASDALLAGALIVGPDQALVES